MSEFSRRGFLKRAGAGATAVVLGGAGIEVLQGVAHAAGGPEAPPSGESMPDMPCGPEAVPGSTPEMGMSPSSLLTGKAEVIKMTPEMELMAGEAAYAQAVQAYYAAKSPEIVEGYAKATQFVRSSSPEVAEDGSKSWNYGLEEVGTVFLTEAYDSDGNVVQATLRLKETTVSLSFRTMPDGTQLCIPRTSYVPIFVRTQVIESAPDTSVDTTIATNPSSSTTTLPQAGSYPPGFDPSQLGQGSMSGNVPTGFGMSAGMQAMADVKGAEDLFSRVAARV